MRIAVEFKDIQLNTNLQLMAGEVKTTYDPEWKNVLDVNEAIGDVKEVADAVSDLYNNIKEFLNNYKGTEEDKRKAGEYEKELNENIKELLDNPNVSTEDKEKLVQSQKDNKEHFEALKTGKDDCGGKEKSKGNGPNGVDYYNLDLEVNFDCHTKPVAEHVDKVNEVYSVLCTKQINLVKTFLSKGNVNYLKLLSCEHGAKSTAKGTKRVYNITSYNEIESKLVLTHYKKWGEGTMPTRELYLVETKDEELVKNKIDHFWISYVPNNVKGDTDTVNVTVYLKDKDPEPKEPLFCTIETTIPKGVSAGAAFSDAVGQIVFYGSLGMTSLEVYGGVKTAQCISGFSLDLGFQIAIFSIVEKYKSTNRNVDFNTVLKNLSLPSAVVSCGTGALFNDCGTKCAGLAGAVVGLGDNILKQIKEGKNITEINLSETFVSGLIQGVVAAGTQKVLTLGISKFNKIYSEKLIKDALEDLEKNPSKYVNDGVNGLENTLATLFAGARQRAIAKFGKEAEDLIYIKFNKDGGAAAEILDHYGTDGLNALKKVSNIQDATNELIKGKIGFRHVSSNVSYLDQMKISGKIPSQTGTGTTYFSLDKFDNPIIAIDKMQLNSKGTDAIWRVEFDATQLTNKAKIPSGKWNNSEYIEVLTRSYPNFGSGGASQFITQSEITIKRLVNLKTGEIINF